MNDKLKLMQIPLKSITSNPHQPRKIFHQEAIQELSESIKRHGLIQPITVRRGENGGYELIAGERRMRACILAELEYVDCIVLNASSWDSATMALIENLQRENLHYLEEAEGYYNLLNDFGLTQEDLAKEVGRSQASIANKLRVLRLPPEVKKALLAGGLTERHARSLLRLTEAEHQLKVIDIIVKRKLSVKQTEQLIDQFIESEKKKKRPKPKTAVKDVRIFLNTIKQAIDLMNESGINAISEKREDEDFIEYIVKIPKS